ncbi:SoxY-related AACIE arm protein [Caenimonas sedimenti]|uniref:SoxY-related AACIE arm protein n=1 Tax=Caenimonas sedimenti TaxID=2596921 RepID=A0A562ZGG6_9BURK|nr:SoxY-related AACIE arm protein [Caenimonas sedimenti]TWO66999.1 SoxY-related AACIE arm protein [Caenimonas sedimenti]
MTDATLRTWPRRHLLQLGAAAVGASWLDRVSAQDAGEMAKAIAQFAGAQQVRTGRVKLDIAPLVDNGNVVPMRVTVESPMSAADHVAEIAVFNEKNPQRDVARFTLGPRSGKADVATRIRLATSQKLVALARMSDGSVWSDTVNVVVVLAACIEGES